MERSIWKDQELNRLESFVRQQNIPENTKDYIEQLIVRASKYCGSYDEFKIRKSIQNATDKKKDDVITKSNNLYNARINGLSCLYDD